MRHFMVDPVNEDRLLKIPPHSQKPIRDEAIRDCIAAVEAISDGGDTDTRYILADTAATLRALLEGEKA